MTHKYNVGDKVRIINYRGEYWNSGGDMDEYMDSIMTIASHLMDGWYKMEEDNCNWRWRDEDIVGRIDTPQSITFNQALLELQKGNSICSVRNDQIYGIYEDNRYLKDDDLSIEIEEILEMDWYVLSDFQEKRRVESKKYYLRDTLINGNENYLNYGMLTGKFRLDCSIQGELVQTKFTDQEIEDLGIPIERFEKLPDINWEMLYRVKF